MARSSLSAGRMISYALDKSQRAAAGGGTGQAARRTRREELVRYMLEYVLRDPKARRAFATTIAKADGELTQFRPSTRTGSDLLDLEASLADDPTIRFAVNVKVDGPIEAEQVSQALAELPSGPDTTTRGTLVLLLPKHRKSSLDLTDERLVRTTWVAFTRRLVKNDPKRAEFWRLIGELGEDAPSVSVYRAGSPRLLLDEDVVAEFRSHLDTMRLAATELYGRPARFSSSRRGPGAWLQVGASGTGLGLEFDMVEEGSPIWLVGSRPQRTHPLNIGALVDDETRDRAVRRLRGIASGQRWRDDPEHVPQVAEFIGERASASVEEARTLLWDVFDPELLTAAGFPLVPRQQPDLDADMLGVRVRRDGDPRAGTFLVFVGGSKNWTTLLPRVKREFDGRTYIVQAKKGDTPEDLVSAVHDALLSLATKP